MEDIKTCIKFIDTCLVIEDGANITSGRLYDLLKLWIKRQSSVTPSYSVLLITLKEKGIKKSDTTGLWSCRLRPNCPI